jgi:DNA-binding IscR family transcriptional regulator
MVGTKTRYGTRAMLDLALNYDNGSSDDIVDRDRTGQSGPSD